MADASGLRLLKRNEYDPLHATTFGTGQMIVHAIESGATKIILCIGGSATVDGATGILRTLGYRFLDSDGNELSDPASLHLLTDYIKTKTDILSNVQFIVLCDVFNPLLGKNGSAAVFGPQKGARPEDIPLLEAGLSRLRALILKKNHIEIGTITHGGAAGGIAAGLYGMLDAQLENGIDYFLSVTGFENEVKKASLVITGEGSLDRQTLEGKAPAGVAKKAKEFNVPVIGFGGKVPDEPDEDLNYYFDRLICINEPFTLLEDALSNAGINLERAAYRLGMEMNPVKK
jgi:glycerate kinase